MTDTSIDGLPDDLVAGVVDVTVTDETEAAGGEVNFTLVEPGTDAAAFVEGLAACSRVGPSLTSSSTTPEPSATR